MMCERAGTVCRATQGGRERTPEGGLDGVRGGGNSVRGDTGAVLQGPAGVPEAGIAVQGNTLYTSIEIKRENNEQGLALFSGHLAAHRAVGGRLDGGELQFGRGGCAGRQATGRGSGAGVALFWRAPAGLGSAGGRLGAG